MRYLLTVFVTLFVFCTAEAITSSETQNLKADCTLTSSSASSAKLIQASDNGQVKTLLGTLGDINSMVIANVADDKLEVISKVVSTGVIFSDVVLPLNGLRQSKKPFVISFPSQAGNSFDLIDLKCSVE